MWALIADRKNAELFTNFGAQIQLRGYYLDLFCDTSVRIGQGWQAKGGYQGFGDHVRAVAARYLDDPVRPLIWDITRPTTSANAHLAIKASELAHSQDTGAVAARALRQAYFSEGQDISKTTVIHQVLAEAGIDNSSLAPEMENGRAVAALLADSRKVREARVAGSPTWRLNEGRQLLYGNVGYRVLSANIEELLRHPQHEASWC